jgi:hypothetical protein
MRDFLDSHIGIDLQWDKVSLMTTHSLRGS